jgi:hypothetical protein
MKKLVLFLCLSVFYLSLNAQYIWQFEGKKEKYGLVKTINRFEREIIVKSKYDTIIDFWENYAIVKLKNKWGFINKEGKGITPIKYDLCRVFSHGYATIKLNDKWGYVDTNGKEKILFGNYDDISNPREIMIFGEWGGITINEISSIFLGSLIVVKINEKYGLIDTNENIVTPCKYDEIDDDWYDDSVFIVNLNDKQGIIDFNGKKVISLKWNKSIPLYFNKTKTNVKLNEKYGLIENYTKKEIFPIKYDAIRQTSKEYRFWVKLNGKYGLIDTTENIIIPFKYTDIRPSGNGYSISDTFNVQLGDKWGMININEREVIPIKYDFIAYYWIGNSLLLSVSLDEKYGDIDRAGNEIISIKYDKEIYFDYGENYTIVEIDEKYGIHRYSGKWNTTDHI